MSLVAIEHDLTIDGQPLDLAWVSVRDELDALGSLEAEVLDPAGAPDPAVLIGKPLHLTLQLRDGSQRRSFIGVVTEASRTTESGDEATSLRVVARPRLYRLTQRSNLRTFQAMTAPDIVRQVLEEGGIPASDQKWAIEGAYPERSLATQYRESDFEFVRRVLSEEGIAFSVDSSGETDVAVFFDGDLGPIDGEMSLRFLLGDGLIAGGDAVGSLTQAHVTAPGKVALRDYDFEKPRFELNAKAEAGSPLEKTLEVYVSPGRFTEPEVGSRYAKRLLDSLRARREVVSGVASTLRLAPGHRFRIEGHPYEPLNREYLLLSVGVVHESRRGPRSSGAQGSRVHFSAIPTEDTTYRPPRLPAAVSAPGAQVAVITGPEGSEIHPDEHGRVKVFFAWDRLGKRDDTSSIWVRTSQMALGGSMLTPRTGWEVSASFEGGDPDRPFVFGRMYNAKTPPPYALPKHKARMSLQTSTTPGGGSTNELRMDDSAGSEEMFMNASKDASISAGNNATEGVVNNETRDVGASQSLAVTDSMTANVGANQSLSVGGNQTVHVSTMMVDDVGSHSLTIGGSRDLKAGGDHKRTVTGASSLTVGGMQVDLVAGSVDEEGLATFDDSVGAALVEMTASNRTVTVKAARTETVGAAKVVIAAGGRAVQVGGSLKQKVGGAILTTISGDRSDTSGGDFLEVAGGAQVIKATNVVFEADSLLSIVMGGSTITLTPASVSIAGTKVTLDGECDEVAALVTDN